MDPLLFLRELRLAANWPGQSDQLIRDEVTMEWPRHHALSRVHLDL
ncbi:hypothetical protein [Catellatospora chokoriensis]|nr:hypothetical protein [Catellatospora chokoriensis]